MSLIKCTTNFITIIYSMLHVPVVCVYDCAGAQYVQCAFIESFIIIISLFIMWQQVARMGQWSPLNWKQWIVNARMHFPSILHHVVFLFLSFLFVCKFNLDLIAYILLRSSNCLYSYFMQRMTRMSVLYDAMCATHIIQTQILLQHVNIEHIILVETHCALVPCTWKITR